MERCSFPEIFKMTFIAFPPLAFQSPSPRLHFRGSLPTPPVGVVTSPGLLCIKLECDVPWSVSSWGQGSFLQCNTWHMVSAQ